MHGCRERLKYVRIAIVYTFRKYTRQHCMTPTSCLHVFLFFVLVHLKYADYFLFSGYYNVLNELSFFDQKMYENRFQTQTNSNVHKKHNAIYNDST